jgi:glycylpeptide N-tetradecanoyltransferase
MSQVIPGPRSTMSSSQKAKAEEIVHPSDDPAEDSDEPSGPDDPVVGAEDNQPSTSQKKKKKRSKAVKALNALRGKNDIPQDLVNHVIDKVKEVHGEGAPESNEDNVRAALEHLKITEVVKGKAGIGGKNRKDMGEHKVLLLTLFLGKYLTSPIIIQFWATQPVPQPGKIHPRPTALTTDCF